MDELLVSQPWYNKVQFRIDYVVCGQPHTYEGRYDLGDGDGGIIEHIRTHADYYRHDEDWQKRFAEQGPEKLAETNEGYDYVLDTFVPYLKTHCHLADVQSHAVSSLEKILMEEPTSASLKMAGYLRATLQYVADCRKLLNTSEEIFDLPAPPEQDAYMRDPATRAYEGRTLAELRQEARNSAMTLDEYAQNGYEPKAKVETKSAQRSKYKDLPAPQLGR